MIWHPTTFRLYSVDEGALSPYVVLHVWSDHCVLLSRYNLVRSHEATLGDVDHDFLVNEVRFPNPTDALR